MRVGIVTHYYHSYNYGGNLQAYALCKCVSSMGHSCEQISFDRTKPPGSENKSSFFRFLSSLKGQIKGIKDLKIRSLCNERKRSVLRFNEQVIPHSKAVYTERTIAECVDHYDAFITGSDQVWHPVAYCSEYGLEFVPKNKLKLSYAASMAVDRISDEYRSRLKKSLSDYAAVSVREKQAVDLLRDVSPVAVEQVLDPTLLLSRDEWDEICSDKRIADDYLFCFFLGDNTKARALAQEFASRKNLRLVTVPFLTDHYRQCDVGFGDERPTDVSPEDFISLIKNAKYVFTDSFHATVFSAIYQKQYFVFDRSLGTSMGSRIRSLLELLHTEKRFCDKEESLSITYIESLPPIDYAVLPAEFEKMKADSLNYLKRSLAAKQNES